MSKDIDSFYELARKIELGEAWNEKKFDRIATDSAIIKKNDTKNGGVADGNDGRGQENLRGTAGRVQGRQRSTRNNQNESQGQSSQNERSQGGFRATLLADKEIDNYESINPTIHTDEWQDMSNDLQGFSNALNEARAANKHGYKEQLEKLTPREQRELFY